MAKTASQIVDRALSLIDEVPTTFDTAATTETSIRDQALAILPEVCRDLVKELPWELKMYLSTVATGLGAVNLTGGEVQSSYVKQKVVYLLPSDYWEFISFKISHWAKQVTEYIYIDGPGYDKQNNPFTRGGKQNPVIAISNKNQSKLMECFSLNDGDSVNSNSLLYYSFDNIPDDSSKTWPDEVFDEVTKALATELHIIKSRINEAAITGEQTANAIEQHE